MSGPPKDGQPSPYFGEYPPDFFDFIVIDECHRGGANDESNWRGILDYFAPAVQLGLTATPKRKDNVDTYAYFGEPVYIYSLKDGINDGFLTPFRVKQISTTLDEYVYTPDDTLIEGEIETGKRYDEADFNKIIEIKEREAHRVKIFMSRSTRREDAGLLRHPGPRPGRARPHQSDEDEQDPNYCQRVTANDGALGEQHLRDFQDNEKTIPTILTTSQKLSTGVDARNIRNIVLMRPINSMIEFKQIIGRGTRLYDGKDYFTIYDFVKAHHHFSDPEWDGEPIEPEPMPERHSRAVATAACPLRTTGCARPPECGTATRAQEDQGQAGRRQGAHDPAHDGDDFWHPDGTPMSAQQFMEMLFGKLPEFFKDEAELRALWSAPDTRAKLLEGLPRRDSAAISWPRCRRSSTPRRATCSTCWPTWPTPCRRSPARNGRRRRKVDHQHPLQQQAAGLPRLRPLALRQRRRRGTRPGEAHAAAEAQVPQRHRRRRRRPRQAGRDRQGVRGLSEVPVRRAVAFSAGIAVLRRGGTVTTVALPAQGLSDAHFRVLAALAVHLCGRLPRRGLRLRRARRNLAAAALPRRDWDRAAAGCGGARVSAERARSRRRGGA